MEGPHERGSLPLDTEQRLTRSTTFVVPQNLFLQFKAALSQEGVSMAKAVEQFLESYTHCLAPSFVVHPHGKGQRKGRGKPFTAVISSDIQRDFVNKTSAEGMPPSVILTQFMMNYVAFFKERGQRKGGKGK